MPPRWSVSNPSIRLSLMLYFLVLLGAALGIVSYLCFDSTQEALAAKEASTRKLFERQFKENKANVYSEFDAKLYDRARNLGNKAIYHLHRIEPLNGLAALGYGPNTLPWQLPVVFNLQRYPLPPNLNLHHDELRIESREGEPWPMSVEEGRYFATYRVIGKTLTLIESSHTLGNAVWTLDAIAKTEIDDGKHVYDEIDLPSGKRVRRVANSFTVLTYVRGVIVKDDRPLGKDKGKGEFPKGGGGRGFSLANLKLPEENQPVQIPEPIRPKMYMLYGEDTKRRDESVAGWEATRDENLANLTQDLSESRAQLRRRLFWVVLGVFAAGLLGGLVVVQRSLSPLKRFSDAVSRISERDFLLPIQQQTLPLELAPIAGRLSHTLGQLKRAFEREKQAAADISHELRTPVAALLTTLDIALRKPRSANEYREVLEDCRFNGQQIHLLVERLLTLARLDAGADLLRPRDVDMRTMTDQCLTLVRPLAEARGIKMQSSCSNGASVVADPDKLREVLSNLLHNAIEYNKTDGSIDVKIERNNGTLDIAVTDTGIGIAPEVQQHIFERFYRADPSRHSDSPHAGLGLAIVKGYVDLMGGAIDVKSTPGVGTTFLVRLPSHNYQLANAYYSKAKEKADAT